MISEDGNREQITLQLQERLLELNLEHVELAGKNFCKSF